MFDIPPILGNVNPKKRWKDAIERAKLRKELEKNLDELNEKNRHEKILGQKWNLKKGGCNEHRAKG